MITSVIILTISLFFSLFFSACETAYTSLQAAQVHTLASKLGKRGRMLRFLYRNPNRILATVLIGNNVANILASVTATQFTLLRFGSSAFGIMTGLLTLVILIFCEIIPKQFALKQNEIIVSLSLHLLYFCFVVLSPVVYILSYITRFFDGKQNTKKTITVQSVVQTLNQAQQMGMLNQTQARIIQGGMAFSSLTASNIMTHRKNVLMISESATIAQVSELFAKEDHSQFPVYKGNRENIVGIIRVKHLLNRNAHESIETYCEVPEYIPSQRSIQEFMHFFSESGRMLIVLDEYGGFSGIITFTDILNSIIGMRDDGEYSLHYTQIGKRTFHIKADTPISLLRSIFPVLPSTSRLAYTIGGYLVHLVGKIPSKNEIIKTDFGTFTVQDVKKTQIISLIYHQNDPS